jgi:hypothetical protein
MDEEKKYSSYELTGEKSDYQWALEEAGATVHLFQEFGSYQGNWYAKVTHNGKTGWIKDSYGSCSGCDSFHAEASYQDRAIPEWKEFCTNFAQVYLDAITTWDEVYKKTKEDEEWDYDAKEAIKFLEENK